MRPLIAPPFLIQPPVVDDAADASKFIQHKKKILDADGNDTGDVISLSCPTFSSGSDEQYINFYFQFTHCASLFAWTNEILWQKFSLHLRDSAHTKWQNMTANIAAADLTTARFNTNLRNFTHRRFDDQSYEAQHQYLNNARKPLAMSIQDFAERLEHIFRAMRLLPNPGPEYTDEQKRHILFNAMPHAWTKQYLLNGRRLTDDAWEDIIQYMKTHQNLSDPPPGRNNNNNSNRNQRDNQTNQNRNQRNNRGTNNNNNNRRQHNNNNQNRRRPNNNNNQNNGKNQRQRRGPTPDDDCPFHPGQHKWSECYSNAYGNNPRNGRAPNQNQQPTQNQNQQNNNRNGNQNNRNNNRNNKNNRRNDQYQHAPPQNQHHHHNHASSDDEDVELQDGYALQSPMMDLTTLAKEPIVPSTILTARKCNAVSNNLSFIVLLDSGGSQSVINKRAIPPNTPTWKTDQPMWFNTINGPASTNVQIVLDQVQLPEFSKAYTISQLTCYVFDDPNCIYDIILGRPFLQQQQFTLCWKTNTSIWMELSLPFKPHNYWTNRDIRLRDLLQDTPPAIQALIEDYPASYFTAPADPPLQARRGPGYRIEGPILESKYDPARPEELARRQTHLSSDQQQQLADLLRRHQPLFDGSLGKYTARQLSLKLKPGTTPYHGRAYPVANIHRALYKAELDRLCSIGVLTKIGTSEWAFPSFIAPKKDGRIRWLSDFRKLNAVLVRAQYPLPNIHDILNRRRRYRFFTKLDLSMQYYCFQLDEPSKQYCIIITPFGKYQYNRLPMGISPSPDFAQAEMERVLDGLQEWVEVYIDDIGVFDLTWEDHMSHLALVFHRLQSAGFTVNPLKCEFAVQETDWLGHWLTPDGIKPWKKKILALQAIAPPRNKTDLRAFIGACTYYGNMWPRRAHILAPLTALSGSTRPWQWTDIHQRAFDSMKALIAEDVLLRFPDSNLPFDIYTDASDLQLGSVIKQNGHPIAYFSRKLTAAQRNYTTTEKELLSVVETLRAFESVLLGTQIRVYTDHKNLTHSNLTSARVLRWRLLIENFAPQFIYVPGKKNIEADALSRLPMVTPDPVNIKHNPPDEDLFLSYPAVDQPFPLDYAYLAAKQATDERLQHRVQNDPAYHHLAFHGIQLVCFHPTNSQPRIALPTSVLPDVIKWYHVILGHPGVDKLYHTISTHFYFPSLKSFIQRFTQHCDACQRYKLPGRGYGTLPPRSQSAQPWDDVAVDLIGPWQVQLPPPLPPITFHALTAIDPVTSLAEIIRIDNKSSAHVAMKFENNWLARYPRPLRCIHDHGGEFTGREFQHVLQANGIKDVPTSIKNPQANAVCERYHQTLGNVLRTLLHAHPPLNVPQANDIIDTCLAAANYASRASIHHALNATPGALVFHRDMLLPIPFMANLHAIQLRQQTFIDRNALRKNLARIEHDYKINDQVLILEPNPDKLAPRAIGPCRVLTIHANGTLTIQCNPNLIQRINIRRVRPYLPHGGGD